MRAEARASRLSNFKPHIIDGPAAMGFEIGNLELSRLA
jgi:hypothetical protein